MPPEGGDPASENASANAGAEAAVAGGGATRSPRRSAEGLWDVARKGVKHAVGATLGFATLRDTRESAFIRPEELEYVRELGEGAFATVELCSWKPTSGWGISLVAVKRLKPEIFQSEDELQHFLDETHLLRRLRHPNIVDFLGVGVTDLARVRSAAEMQEKMYLVQEYMNRGTMKSMVLAQLGSGRGQWYSDKQAILWMLQLAKGLRYLHRCSPKVIHRDIKLANILLSETDAGEVVAKLADFGLHAMVKKRTDEGGSRVLHTVSSHSIDKLAGTAALQRVYSLQGNIGSLMYMAPEVKKCEKYNERCDIFSLGIAIFEVFHRKPLMLMMSAMGDISTDEEFSELVAEGIRPPMPSHWPSRVTSLIMRCWDQDQKKRPKAEDLVRELQSMYDDDVCWTPDRSGCPCCSLQ